MSSPLPKLRVYPVVVGVNRYAASTPMQSFDLEFAARDATRIADFLVAPNAAFETISFQPFLDEAASAERIRQALRQRWTSQRVGTGDVLLFYFAGHGTVTPDGHAYLCCTDTNFRDPNSGGLRLDDLYSNMQRVHAETVIVLLDACFSGSLVDPGTINQHPAQQIETILRQTLPQSTGNRVILAACHANQKARENPVLDGGTGIFTSALLRGWRDGEARGADGAVTSQSLAEYLQRQFVAHPLQQPVTVVAGGNLLTLGRFEPVPAGMGVVAPPTRPSTTSTAGVFDPTNARTPVAPLVQVRPRPTRPPAQPQKRVLIALAGTVCLLALCGILVVVSTQLFVLAFAGVCVLAVASVPLAGPFKALAVVLTVIQAVLLVGVLNLRFGLGRGIAPIEVVAQYAWLAVIVLLVQLAVVCYRVADYFTSS